MKFEWGLLLRQPYATWVVEGKIPLYLSKFPPPKEVEGKRIVILAGTMSPEHKQVKGYPIKKAIGTVLVKRIIRNVDMDSLRKGKIPEVSPDVFSRYPMHFVRSVTKINAVIFAEPDKWEQALDYRREKPTINWAKDVEVLEVSSA